MRLIVAYSTDDNYAQHVGVSMFSLFENNKEFEEITVYIIENSISINNKEKLQSVCKRYGRQIVFVDFSKFSNSLKLNIGNSISISSYARLFLASMLPEEVGKAIYLDCDSIVYSSIKGLWDTDITDYYIAGVSDTVSDETKFQVGVDIEYPYINAGMILINIKKWRDENIEGKLIEFIESHNGRVFHHDQGTINGVLHKRCFIVHPKYNVMTIFFTMSREQIINYYGLKSYYSETELKEAIEKPVFVHYTPAFVNRPWVKGCKHPLTSEYIKYLKMTPWMDMGPIDDTRRFRERLISFLYNYTPFRVANSIRKLLFNS